MTFREAFFAACEKSPKATKGHLRKIAKARNADPTKHKRLWKRMEDRVAKRYEEQTGKKFTTWGDGSIIKWLSENLPAILKMIMSILALFGV